MSTNDYRPHIHIIPEDRANEEIANVFIKSLSSNNRSVRVLRPQGGWKKVRDWLDHDRLTKMRSGKGMNRILILLIDFDGDPDRLQNFKNNIPDGLIERIFVLGSESNPEKLRTALGITFESIGQRLAKECDEDDYDIWDHALLKGSRQEINRMGSNIKEILFG